MKYWKGIFMVNGMINRRKNPDEHFHGSYYLRGCYGRYMKKRKV